MVTRKRPGATFACVRVTGVLALLFAVGCDGPAPSSCTPAYGVEACAIDEDAFECRFGQLHRSRVSPDAMREVLDTDERELDALLRVLFPMIGDREIVDAPPESRPLAFEYSTFPTYAVSAPVDWSADPYGNNSWVFYFQNLSWITDHLVGADLDAVAAIVVDWALRGLQAEPALSETWVDHAISARVNAVGDFLEAYVDTRSELDRGVLHAVAQIFLTHIYALGSGPCYRVRHNHGVMQDLALLRQLPRAPNLVDRSRLTALASERLVEQAELSVTADGIHIENSPHYHLLYAQLLTHGVDLYLSNETTPPETIVDVRDQLLDALVYQLQPNHSLPQFGDTPNDTKRPELTTLVDEIREQGIGDPTIVDRLDWVLSRGVSGSMPPEVDRVFAVGGYAAFRQGWPANDADQAIAAHFRSGKYTSVHYHRDETTFEIYGYGTELIVNPGVYSYDFEGDPLAEWQRSPAAHNILVVEGAQWGLQGRSGILGHAAGADASWVQGNHDYYERLGVNRFARTFLYARPDRFAVVDHVRSSGHVDYTQHFHLHPSLVNVSVVDPRTVVARPERRGPSLVIRAATEPARITTERGTGPDGTIHGWHFPAFRTAEPATDVALHYEGAPGDADLAVVIVVLAPGVSGDPATEISYREEGERAIVELTEPAQTIEVPAR